MARRHIVSLLLLAAARVAGAEEPATNTQAAPTAEAVTSAPPTAASAPATPALVAATTHEARKRAAGTKPGEGKADPAALAGQAGQPGGDVKMSGMSILGNEDAPKSLVIVPWKSSQLADMPSVSRLLDDTTQPVDKDVFMRELAYYEFKSGSK